MLKPGDVIWLIGDLGTGKTTLVQGMAAGWGSMDPVSSPTFVLVNMYRRADDSRLYHLDAYRLDGPSEAIDLDIDEMLYKGSLVVEWADRIGAVLPSECLRVSLRWMGDTHRDLYFTAKGKRYQTLLLAFREKVYGAS
jgi:tRNA threonylcarbamoyladenosine biosynthesis protein TsaE